jgi:hypothetical protein
MKSLKLSPSASVRPVRWTRQEGKKHEFVWQQILTARNEDLENIIEISFNLTNEEKDN